MTDSDIIIAFRVLMQQYGFVETYRPNHPPIKHVEVHFANGGMRLVCVRDKQSLSYVYALVEVLHEHNCSTMVASVRTNHSVIDLKCNDETGQCTAVLRQGPSMPDIVSYARKLKEHLKNMYK